MSELSKTGSSVTGVVKTLLLLAACVCLYSIWALDLLPFQDYASHLFQVEVLAHPDRFPAAVFETHFTVGPYSGFYLLMRGLATVMPVELAGRIFLSLYVALVAALAWRVQRVSGAAISGGAALLIPAAMNQQYVLGNTNFYFAIPLAIFALLDFDELLDANWNRLGLVRQGVWQLLVLLFHPLVFLAVVGLTGASVLLKAARERRATSLMAFPAIGLIVYFITASGAAAGGGWYWMPLSRTLTYLGIFFSDLRIPRDPLSILSIVGWVSVAGIAALSIR
ncbi:hypothetical protein GC173_03440, partial [bacterium]|nr:hypothetical protein [bacterium]